MNANWTGSRMVCPTSTEVSSSAKTCCEYTTVTPCCLQPRKEAAEPVLTRRFGQADITLPMTHSGFDLMALIRLRYLRFERDTIGAVSACRRLGRQTRWQAAPSCVGQSGQGAHPLSTEVNAASVPAP